MSAFERRERDAKIDILDLLISVLREQEKILDHAIERLETLASRQSVQEERMKTMLKYYQDFSK